MTRPERYTESGKVPILCPKHTTPNGHGMMLAEIDTTGIYLWCKRCHKSHHLSLSQLQKAISEITTQQDASTSVEAVV